MRTGTDLSEEILSQTVTGLHLAGDTLREQLGSGRTLLLFLRHLG